MQDLSSNHTLVNILTLPKKIQNVKTFCKDINGKVVPTPFKISDRFSYKDPLLFYLQSFIVYKFICASCKVCYGGKTTSPSSPESKSTYRKTLRPISLNCCRNHVYVIVSALRIVFQ